MSFNQQRTQCGYVSSSGRPCGAWAVRGSDPPRCSAHSERKGGAGAPPKDRDHRTHRFYSTAFRLKELADLEACAEELSLDDEIASMRVMLRRILALLSAEGQPEEGHPHGGAPTGAMTHHEYARLARLALEGGRTVAHLLRDRRALSGEAADGLAGAFSQALDELSVEWGIEL
jgi:hypothetical protein